MFSKFFINRPIFATVVSIVIILAGVIAIKSLPVQEYPSIAPPQTSFLQPIQEQMQLPSRLPLQHRLKKRSTV